MKAFLLRMLTRLGSLFGAAVDEVHPVNLCVCPAGPNAIPERHAAGCQWAAVMCVPCGGSGRCALCEGDGVQNVIPPGVPGPEERAAHPGYWLAFKEGRICIGRFESVGAVVRFEIHRSGQPGYETSHTINPANGWTFVRLDDRGAPLPIHQAASVTGGES